MEVRDNTDANFLLRSLPINNLESVRLPRLYEKYKATRSSKQQANEDELIIFNRLQHDSFLRVHLDLLPTLSSSSASTTSSTSSDVELRAILQRVHNAPSSTKLSDLHTVQHYVRKVFHRVGEYLRTHPDAKSSIRDIVNLVKNLIYPFEKIGNGKSCDALVGYFRDTQQQQGKTNGIPLCLMKVVNEEISADPDVVRLKQGILLHETAIGYLLNRLCDQHIQRNVFVYTYSGFLCNPEEQGSEHVETHFDHLKVFVSQQYLGKTNAIEKELKIYLDELRSQNVSSETQIKLGYKLVHHVLLQVAHALYVAQKHLQFMHYDLHTNNVLLRRASPNEMISLRFEDLKVQLKLHEVRLLPTIIDYGYSACKTQDGVMLPNRWSFKETNMIALGNGSIETGWFLPYFDLYRYTTCVFLHLIEHSTSTEEDTIVRLLYKHWIHRHFTNVVQDSQVDRYKQVFTLSAHRELGKWRKAYLSSRLAYPSKDEKHLFETFAWNLLLC